MRRDRRHRRCSAESCEVKCPVEVAAVATEDLAALFDVKPEFDLAARNRLKS